MGGIQESTPKVQENCQLLKFKKLKNEITEEKQLVAAIPTINLRKKEIVCFLEKKQLGWQEIRNNENLRRDPQIQLFFEFAC